MDKSDVKKAKTEDVKEEPLTAWVMMEAEHGVARIMYMIEQTLLRHICLNGMCPGLVSISAAEI